jgi:hypothetical protein
MTDKPITYAMLRFADATEIMIEFSVGQHLDQALAELRLAATGDTAMHQASDTGDDDALLTRLLRHIESLEAHGAGNTERLSFDDLVAIADRLQAKGKRSEPAERLQSRPVA